MKHVFVDIDLEHLFVREDTGEIHRERAMVAEELQENLFPNMRIGKAKGPDGALDDEQ